MNKSIFISKPLSELDALNSFCTEKGIHLIAESLIRFEAVPFTVEKPYEVVFISSIRAAEFFIKATTLLPDCKIACIGETTADKLKNLGLSVDFTGEKAGKPDEVADAFKTWLGDRKVIIPQSNISKRSIASKIAPEQCIEVIVYRTLSNCKPIPSCSRYIFTSPSNFESFLLCNNAPKGKIIAWGETTKRAILEHGLGVDYTLEGSGLGELVGVLGLFK